MNADALKLEMKGIDPPLANAFRRILIAEIPTVAISEVRVMQNTGVIPDSNLVHRLGLVPIVFEPDNLSQRTYEFDEDLIADVPQETLPDPAYSVTFALKVSNPNPPAGNGVKRNVYSRELVWQPHSEEERKAFSGAPPKPVANDIMIAKLAPGQEIDLICFAERGIGKQHIKWSPVCNATYRMVQNVHLARPVVGDDAEKLQEECPPGVIELVQDEMSPMMMARVADTTKFTVHRQRLEPFAELGVSVESAKDHYIFNIESVGHLPAPDLLARALKVLKRKCQSWRGTVTQMAKDQNESERKEREECERAADQYAKEMAALQTEQTALESA